MKPLEIQVDEARLMSEIEHLAGFTDAPPPAVTRVLFTPTDRKARAWMVERFREAGLEIRADAVGNLFARWEGSESEAAPVATGSHTDAIPYSGRYDGVVGVLGALEAFRALRRAGFQPRRSLDLILFTAEEPTRFGLGCLGSRALSGAIEPHRLAALQDAEGVSFDDARRSVGYEGLLERAVLPTSAYAAFIELHIEQGPLLEAEGKEIGVVTSIAAPATLRIKIEGEGGHAGAVLMPYRRDALVAGAELALAVERAAHESGSIDTVATTGVFQVHPGAVNSIPSRVVLEIDVRDVELERRDRTVARIVEAAEAIGGRRKVEIAVETLNADPPASAAREIVEAVCDACATRGLSKRLMVSRAYHDALFMARIAPAGMIFIPSRGGVSHRPDEYSSPLQIRHGTEVLALTLARLADEAPTEP